jgi:hypothetical protein
MFAGSGGAVGAVGAAPTHQRLVVGEFAVDGHRGSASARAREKKERECERGRRVSDRESVSRPTWLCWAEQGEAGRARASERESAGRTRNIVLGRARERGKGNNHGRFCFSFSKM